MTTTELVELFWGKAGHQEKGTSELHPALFHMLDVGMVARAMVERSPQTALRGLRCVAGLDTDEAARRIGFLIALHDLGKISPGFQEKRCDLTGAQRTLGYFFPPNAETDHSRITQHHLRWRGGKDWAAEVLARALGAHHGAFHRRECAQPKDGAGLWQDAREAAIAALAEIFGVDADAALRPLEFCPSDAMILAGLTTVADWIGSDKRFFVPEGEQPRPLHEYAAHAYKQAFHALSVLGWDPWRPDGAVWEFPRLFPTLNPNALQRLTAHLAGAVNGPCLVVIEAPMGMGKTEAALHLADVLLNRFGHAGLYDALPTQATSSQMFRRVRDYLSGRLLGQSANLHLLHGLAAFDDAYAELLEGTRAEPPQPSDISGVDGTPGSPEAALEAAAWFRGRKLGLLSPFAVGTVDQALQGVLQTRHMFVRLHGLANKVVLIDEAHAYDTYTSTLLNCLIEWLGALGCTVIILSATLPAVKRCALVQAYAGEKAQPPIAGYPRITVAARDRETAEFAIAGAPEREVALECLPVPVGADTHAVVADRLAEELHDGGCAGWICNTVDAAQMAYLCLARLRREDHPVFRDADLVLYHARFPAEQRQQIETEIDRKFGKMGIESGARPYRAVLIGTQVLEQALDYSVDLMVTELAPVDLVLQRSGRLHRHAHARPGALQEPRLLWVAPAINSDGEPQFGVSGKIYDEAVLLRSWLSLRERAAVRHPRGIEDLVEEVYGDRRLPIPDSLQALARELERRAGVVHGTHAGEALTNAIYPPDDEDPFRLDRSLPGEEAATDVLGIPGTRRAEPNVTLICAHQRADGIFLSCDDTRALDLNRLPDHAEEARLLRRSVRVQNRHWVAHFRAQEPPAGWKDSPTLRHHRLAIFIDGQLTFGGRTLRLDPVLGLVTSAEVLEALGG